ncbi:MAG: right-handed parallel beta-helix repeat-containing protein [Candidatus Dormibacteria bacterium]
MAGRELRVADDGSRSHLTERCAGGLAFRNHTRTREEHPLRHFSRFGIVGGLALLVGTLGTVTATPAYAAHVTCGQTITVSTVLDSDVGPCATGLTIGGNNITLDLNQFTIFGTPGTGEGPGIFIEGRPGDVVRNGTVRNFDAGVAIESGATGNTVTRMVLQDNIGSNSGDYGDGVVLFGTGTTGNTVNGNVVRHNGPFDGIGLVGAASGNTISRNDIIDNNTGGQDTGIRIEGPGAKNNTITGNVIRNSGLDGIEGFGFTNLNSGSVITNNVVSGNARHGIVLFRNPAAAGAANSLVQNNIISNNRGAGLLVQSLNNQLVGNRSSGNTALDLQDTNANCDNNAWHGNSGTTFSPACTLNP